MFHPADWCSGGRRDGTEQGGEFKAHLGTGLASSMYCAGHTLRLLDRCSVCASPFHMVSSSHSDCRAGCDYDMPGCKSIEYALDPGSQPLSPPSVDEKVTEFKTQGRTTKQG